MGQEISADRGLPSNLAAEKAILGAIVLENDLINEVIGKLKPQHFYLDSHRRIYSRLCDMSAAEIPIDTLTLADELGRGKELQSVGGAGYLASLTEGVPRRSSIDHYVQLVLDAAAKRKIIIDSNAAISRAIDGSDSPREILEKMEQNLAELDEGREETMELAGAVAARRYEAGVGEFYRRLGRIHGLSTGFLDLDDITHGLVAPRMYIVAARPSMGKTALATGIAEDVAIVQNKVVVVFSLEMSREELIDRMIFSQAGIDAERVRNGTIFAEDERRMHDAMAAIHQAPLYVDDKSGITPAEMVAKCKKLKGIVGALDLVIVDYLQLMNPGVKLQNREQEVAYCSRKLKELAKKLGVPVIALSQLNRGIEGRTPKDAEPKLADLRESGGIEQDADVVVMLLRPSFYDPDNEELRGITKAYIRKNRHGRTGNFQMAFLGGCTRFETLRREDWIGSKV